ncbi:MAG: ribulose-phosphate 3-epimerase [Acidobacteria bacterium]|nr:MAG: ribulose-phosphate 3-epimerase [Acidobacteriota bacterium]RPJ84361.1 MAG: ribulose-phosphate 3-epimerase [Acidobacteriota bacterium]
MNIRIAPSILAADFAVLGEAVAAVESGGADLIHIDVMDGHFVPNITVGPLVVRALKRVARVPLSVHLMIEKPERYVEAFADAGASILTVHVEAAVHLHRTIELIHGRGVKAGVALNPATPVSTLEEVAALVDQVLVMSVNPGFGGQAFIPRSESKVRAVRALLDRERSAAAIAIDGGIDRDTIRRVVEAGAEILVAGVAIFHAQDPAAATRELKALARGEQPT